MNHRAKYYLLAFLEGFGVLAAELLGGKMLAPYYGSSLIIWTMVIGMTLVCLTAGYYLGSRLAARGNQDHRLFGMFSLGAFFLALMPVSTLAIFNLFSGLSLFLGVTLATFFLLGPPLVSLGATSPILIQLATQKLEKAGRVSGNIYALSTLGGIIASFLLGFVIIPKAGISIPSLIISGVILAGLNILLVPRSWIHRLTFGIPFLFPVLMVLNSGELSSEKVTVLFEEEGIFGQLKVVDTDYEATDAEVKARQLLLNGIPQTNVVKGDFEARSFFNYVHNISTIASMKPSGSRVLIAGLGGGSLVVEFEKLGFRVDAVDIDGRLLRVANEFFYLDYGGVDFVMDDARHFIKGTPEKYDLIVMDLLVAEAQPEHLYTKEAFELIRSKLNPEGILILNFQGYFEGPEGLAARSIFKTLQVAGFEVHAMPSSQDAVADIIYVAGPEGVPFEDLSPRRINACCVEISHTDLLVANPRQYFISDPDLSDAHILRDDKPYLNMLRMETVLEFRRNKIKSIAKKELEDNVRMFK